MASNFILPYDVVLQILQYLDMEDKITFANACDKFKQICLDAGTFSKVDLSRCVVTRQTTIKEFLHDKQMAEHIKELNLNNHRVMNWLMDMDIEEFIIACSPQLEALHVLHCGMSFKSLRRILKPAYTLTQLSWSLIDLTAEDIVLLMKDMESSDGICLQNIRYLHLEVLNFKPHLEILRYLVLSRCKHLEELEIYVWQSCMFEIGSFWECISFCQLCTSITNTLLNLHSLTVLAMGNLRHNSTFQCEINRQELSDFILLLVSKKSPETKWKKFLISPSLDVDIFWKIFHLTNYSANGHIPHGFHSVEALAASGAVDAMTTLFQKINDNAVKKLHLCVNHYHPHDFSVLDHILRTSGHALRYLSLSGNLLHTNFAFNILFSYCPNITELDLLPNHFLKNICESLSKLKHLLKIQIPHCAILSKHNENQLEKANANLQTFVENCQNIAELDVRACHKHLEDFTCHANDNLLPLAKLKKLKSLTLYNISYIGQCTFLKKISEHCKFLTMLRICVFKDHDKSYFTILESVRFLKHVAISMSQIDLGSEDFWKFLSHARNLERLCIRCSYKGSINVVGAVQMVKSLPRLHLLHVHYMTIENSAIFCDQMVRTLQEEKSDRIFCFEVSMYQHLYMNGQGQQRWTYKQVHPINRNELCLMTPILATPTF